MGVRERERERDREIGSSHSTYTRWTNMALVVLVQTASVVTAGKNADKKGFTAVVRGQRQYHFRHQWWSIAGKQTSLLVPAIFTPRRRSLVDRATPVEWVDECKGCAPTQTARDRIGPIWGEVTVDVGALGFVKRTVGIHTCVYSVIVMLLHVCSKMDKGFEQTFKLKAEKGDKLSRAIITAMSGEKTATSTRDAWIQSLPAAILFLCNDGIPCGDTNNWNDLARAFEAVCTQALPQTSWIRVKYPSVCGCPEHFNERLVSPVLNLLNNDMASVDRLQVSLEMECDTCKAIGKRVRPLSFMPPDVLFLVGMCQYTYRQVYDVAGVRYRAFGVGLGDGKHNVLKMWDKSTTTWLLADDAKDKWTASSCPCFVVRHNTIRVVGLIRIDATSADWTQFPETVDKVMHVGNIISIDE